MKEQNKIVKQTRMSVGCWNVQGLFPSDDYKTYNHLFLKEIGELDLVGLVETHTIEGQNYEPIEGFDTKYFHRPKHNRARSGSGGIAILAKPHIVKGLKYFPSKENNYIWIKLDKYYFTLQQDIYLCVAYIPPPDSTYSKRLQENILDSIETDVYKYKEKGDVLLMGDLNARVGHGEDYIGNDNDKYIPLHEGYVLDSQINHRMSQDLVMDDRGKHLLEVCLAGQMRILNGRKIGDTFGYFTCHKYNGSSVVDYGVASERLTEQIMYFRVHPFIGSLSDHCMISLMLMITCNDISAPPIELSDIPVQFKWDENSEFNFKTALQFPIILKKIDEAENNINDCTDEESLNKATLNLSSIYIEVAKLTLKMKSTKRPKHIKKPWISSRIKQMEREVNKKGQMMIKYRTGESRIRYFRALKLFRKERKYARRYYFKQKMEELNLLETSNPKKFWALLQDIKDGKAPINHADKIEPGIWYDYIMNKNKNKTSPDEENYLKDFITKNSNKSFTELDYSINKNELHEAMKKLKNGKSPGLDQITNQMIKAGSDQLNTILLRLFNKVFSLSIYPNTWSVGFITNIFKKGSFHCPQNYRGITITSSVGKLFNSILNFRLQKYLLKNELISPCQIGFEKGSSTADHIFTLKTAIDKYTANSGKLYACFVDYKQAFDSVWNTALFAKLSSININNYFLRIIQSMYAKTQLCIKTRNKLTPLFPSDIGVKQGDNLSPTLFNVYVNDIPECIQQNGPSDPIKLGKIDISCLLYADDLVLLSTTKQGLQKCINAIHKYSTTWKLDINTEKTKVLIFNKRGRLLQETFQYGTEEISCVDRYTYLGVEFTSSGTFSTAIKHLQEKSLKALYKLYKLLDSNYKISTIFHIFNHTIKPILLYGAEVWGLELGKFSKSDSDNNESFEKNLDNNPLAQLELKFYKRILQVKRNTATLAVRGELGVYPISIEAICRSISYFNNISNKPLNKVVQSALAESMAQYNSGTTSWYGNLVKTCQKLNIQYTSPETSKYKIKRFRIQIEKQLKGRYNRFWFTNINLTTAKNNKTRGNKLRTYNKLKVDFNLEKYLIHIENINHRKALAQLRLSSHPLNIEAQRGIIIDPLDRICQFCNLNEVEDEEHFLLHCPLYRDARVSINHILNDTNIKVLNSHQKFVWILTNEDKAICKKLGQFVYSSFNIRRDHINKK